MDNQTLKIGVAIATFNRTHRLDACLQSIFTSTYENLSVVVFDDGTDMKTEELLRTKYSEVTRLSAEKELWWAESTNRAARRCVDDGCDAVMILNDDCEVEPTTIDNLVNELVKDDTRVLAPVVRNINNKNEIWWAGARSGLKSSVIRVWGIYSLYKNISSIEDLPTNAFATSEVTGRGTFISRKVFNAVGFLDSKVFPQYGSDNDFSLRLEKTKYNAVVTPKINVLLHTGDGGQVMNGKPVSYIKKCYRLLFKRKYGALAIVWFLLLWRHAPKRYFLSSYLVIIVGIIYRALRSPSSAR